MIGRREYYLAGRGTKQECQSQLESLRKEWSSVRILPYGYGDIGRKIDDFSLWVHGRKIAL